MVYTFVPTRDDQPFLALDDPDADGDRLLHFFDGTAKGSGWEPPTVTYEGSLRSPVDLMAFNYAPGPVVNAAGREFLAGICGEWVEFLPMGEFDEPRWLAHVLLVSDALDTERTDYRSSGLPFRYAFRAEELNALPVPLFKLVQSRASQAFATESFTVAYEASGLDGFKCQPVPQIR